MLVWGGQNDNGLVGQLLRYSPTGDSWQLGTTVGEPAHRMRFDAVWTGSEMLVWGGDEDDVNEGVAGGGRYDPPEMTFESEKIGNSKAITTPPMKMPMKTTSAGSMSVVAILMALLRSFSQKSATRLMTGPICPPRSPARTIWMTECG